MKYAISLCAALILISCTVGTQPELPVPPPLVAPVIKAAELECVTDDTYKKIKMRNELQKARIKRLENIIKTTRN